jgi:hypothetical protein
MGSTDPTSAPASPPLAQRLAPFRTPFVWGLWALLSAGLVAYVGIVNDDFPMADDWHLVPVYTGNHPVTLSWLWTQYNEHRMPLSRLLLVLGGAVSGHDYRTGMFLSALALSGLAALMIRTAGRLRGGPSFADAFFPLVLLHWGQYGALLISFGLNLVASAVLSGMALVVLVGLRGAPTLRQGLLFGACLLALPLCGSNGAVLVPPLALWLVVAAVNRWRSGEPHGRRDGTVLMALALAAVALLAVYLLSLGKSPDGPKRPGPFEIGQTASQFFAVGLGLWARPSWPLSGAVVAAVALLTLLKLARDWRTRPAERLRIEGLLCFGGALLALALALGWGRRDGFDTRYTTMAAPALCLAYFVSRPAPRPVVAWGLFVLMAALFVINTVGGIERAEARRKRMHDLQADVAAGRTPAEMATKWTDEIFASGAEEPLTEYFEMLRRSGQGPYKRAAQGRGD